MCCPRALDGPIVAMLEAWSFKNDIGLYQAFSNRGIEVKLASVSLFDCGPFFVPTGIPPAPRGAAVNDGRRPPAQPARSVIDGGEHGADPEVVGLARVVPLLSSASSKPSCRSTCRTLAGIMVLSEVDTIPPQSPSPDLNRQKGR